MYGYGQAVCLPCDICTFLLIRIFFTLLDEAFFIVTCDEVSFLFQEYSADVLKNKMAYEMIIISHFHMPFFFVENILCYALILISLFEKPS